MRQHTITMLTTGVDDDTFIQILERLLAPLEPELEAPWTIVSAPAYTTLA